MMTSEQKWLDFLKEKPIWLGPQGKAIVLILIRMMKR